MKYIEKLEFNFKYQKSTDNLDDSYAICLFLIRKQIPYNFCVKKTFFNAFYGINKNLCMAT